MSKENTVSGREKKKMEKGVRVGNTRAGRGEKRPKADPGGTDICPIKMKENKGSKSPRTKGRFLEKRAKPERQMLSVL